MSFPRRLALRLRAVFAHGRLQREMDEEMRLHLDRSAERLVARGMSPEDARAAARREFGNYTVTAADARTARGAQWAESVVTDARLAARSMRRSPLFAVVAVLSIAIGVGATTAIVAIANAALLTPPPGVNRPDRIVAVGRTQNGNGFDTFSYPNFLDLAAGATTLSSFAAMHMKPQWLSLAGPSGGEAVQAAVVSGSFFGVLETRPALGRLLTPNDDQPSVSTVPVVISHRFWQRRFGGDSSILGRKVLLNGSPFTVIGVGAEGFRGPFVFAPDMWITIRAWVQLNATPDLPSSRRSVWLTGIARLAANQSLDQAQAQLSSIAASLRAMYPVENEGKGIRVTPLSPFPRDMQRVVAGFMTVLFAVAALVLAIASTNVAGMLLARATSRQREVAVRIALGASRRRLVRQLATETLVVGLVAGVAGVVMARWLVRALMLLVPRLPVQIAIDPRLDWRVLLFAFGAAILTALAVGILPALKATRPELVSALKIDAGATGRRQRLRGALLVSQIAFSMLLLIVAGLFARTLVAARAIDPGFDPSGVEYASLDLHLASYDDARGAQQAAVIEDRVRRLPGVSTATISVMLPLSGGGMGLGPIQVDGRAGPDRDGSWDADWDVVTPDYFATMRIPLARGRDFDQSDRTGAPNVAIVNETFARRLFGAADAVGRTFRNGDRTVTIVGVARDSKYRTLGEEPRNFVYVPFAQQYMPRVNLIVHTASSGLAAAAIRRVVSDVDPALPVLDQQTMDAAMATSLFPQRIALWVTGTLGLVALLLAIIGIYGVVAYSVAQRTREIGVRVALGAASRTILGLVLRQGLTLVAGGIVVGALAALAITRVLRDLLYGVPPTDVVAFAGAAALLGVAALLASWLPARRATRVDPVIALRSE